jgi:hypothetical protein
MHSRILLGVGLLGLVGCGVFGSDSSPSDPAPTPPAAEPPAAMGDGGLPEGAPPPAVGTPANDELTNEFGVFVTAAAPAGGDGTKEHPFATISAGIERVKDLKLRVYVCAGTYKESLTLVNAVSVISALSCDGGVWKTGGARAVLEAPTSPAIRAKDIALATRLEGFDVTAPVGTAMAPNSIALIAESATMLTVANTKLTSAKAFDGADGTDGVPLTLGAAAAGAAGLPFDGRELAANPITGPQQQAGGAPGIGSCVGAPGHNGEPGSRGGAGDTLVCKGTVSPVNPSQISYRWYVYSSQVRTDGAPTPGGGGPGAAGNDGTSASAGTFVANGYTPAGGTAGADGAVGHGGKGGDGAPQTNFSCQSGSIEEGKNLYDASGGGGGAGGCPGLAGTPGTGGGASAAALVFASLGLTFTATELVAGTGGNGGKGVFGSMATGGGAAGAAYNGATAGAPGGAGGRAGFSGNGAGGPSVALAYTGGAVVLSPDSHTTAGFAGAGVAARTNPTTNVTIPASPSGPAMPVFQF